MIKVSDNELKYRQGYLCVLFFFLILRSVNVYSFLPSIIDSGVFALLALVGIMFIVKDIWISVVKNHQFPYSWWLVAYLFIIAASTLINHKYQFTGNVNLLVWETIYFLMIFELAREGVFTKKFYSAIAEILIGSWFFQAVISLGMFVTQFSYNRFYTIRDRVRIGFVENRLFGVFGEPNYGATTCLLVIILSVYFLMRGVSKKWRIFLWTNIVLQYLVIVLTGSRTALLLGMGVTAVVIFIKVLGWQRLAAWHPLLRIAVGLVLGAVGAVSLYGVVDLSKIILTKIPALFHQFDLNDHGKKDSADKINLDRADVDGNKDISNMRFSIWMSALQLFKSKWLLGTSPRGVVPYAQDAFPKGFIAQQGIVTHNAYINVLTSTGILGFVAVIGFYLKQAFTVLRDAFLDKDFFRSYKGFYFLVIMVILVFGFFNNEMLLVNNVGSFIIWLFLGRLVSAATADNK
jgi:O-antigen ligase